MTVVDAPPADKVEGGRRRAPRRTRVQRTGTSPEWLSPVTVTLAVFAVLGAWLGLFLGPLSGLQEGRAQNVGYSTFREELASGVNPPPPFAPGSTLAAGDPVALLNIPVIGINNVVVFEGSNSADLEKGPGHLPGSALPGEAGWSTLLGRAVGFGGPFAKLSKLKVGDPITATTGQGVFHFKVVGVRGPGQALSPALTNASSRLTLITSANHGWRNLWVPTHAISVDAVLQGTAAALAPQEVATAADQPMRIDSGGLIVLVLWLQLLLIAAIGVAWAVARWGRWQAWVIGAPIVVAVLWESTGHFFQLLPNLL